MNVGDMVRNIQHGILIQSNRVGIIIETIIHDSGISPSFVKVLWNSGKIDKEWTDDLEIVNESR